MNGTIFDIKHFAVHDGPGVRTTIFLKGCPLTCKWCHNPESWKAQAQTIREVKQFDGGQINTHKTIGKEYTLDEVIDEVMKDEVIMRESQGGVTLSGGEPFFQKDFSLSLLKAFKQKGLHTVVDTSGYVSRKVLEESIPYTNLFLYDFKVLDNKLHEQQTGVPNNIILENFDFLTQQPVDIWVRIPLIPGLNDDENNINGLLAFLKQKKESIQKINILPFHRTGFHKFEKLGMVNPVVELEEIEPLRISNIKEAFEGEGFDVLIGG